MASYPSFLKQFWSQQFEFEIVVMQVREWLGEWCEEGW